MKKSSDKKGNSEQILAWEDDPESDGAKPVLRKVPNLTEKRFHVSITGKEIAPSQYRPASAGFRYWVAAEALRRAADFWSALVAKRNTWQPGNDLRANLDHGTDLNAYYDREGLWFFHANVAGRTIYSGESPDVLCHELGHAVLDAIRPDLWDLLSGEIAAFHESFGDISAILSALQLQSVREIVIEETQGRLYRNCRVSRLAEQLGWAIRQQHPDAVETDCLRNAVNSFFYHPPESLPDYGPASQLSAEPHSFSRVFTAAIFECLSGIVSLQSGDAPEQQLKSASVVIAKLLLKSIVIAPAVSDYYSQIAAHMIESDLKMFEGKHAEVLKSAFVRRGILSLRSAVRLKAEIKRVNKSRRVSGSRSARLRLPARDYGLKDKWLTGLAPSFRKRLKADPVSSDGDSQKAARSYVNYLFRRGRVAINDYGVPDATLIHPQAHKTHRVVQEESYLKLIRVCFDCGF